MKAQFKYAFRQNMSLRLTALAAAVLINLAFGAMGYFRLTNNSMLVTATAVSGLSLAGLFIVNIIADWISLRNVIGTPGGYLYALTPSHSGRLLFARAAAAVSQDCVAIFIGTAGVLWQVFNLVSYHGIHIRPFQWITASQIARSALMYIMMYSNGVMLVVFGAALVNTVFFVKRGKFWLGLLGALAASWALNLLNYALIPLTGTDYWRTLQNIALSSGASMNLISYVLLSFVRIGALWIASSLLLEKKANLA